jgi:4-hydroxy-tetrahydrodipicolinate reductase
MTTRIGIAGLRGRMGQEVAALAASDPDVVLVGGVSRQIGVEDAGLNGIRMVCDPAELTPHVDVLIDFTSPRGAVDQARACVCAGIPLVSGTTGLDISQMAVLRTAAESIAVFHATNMSPGVNATLAILPALVRALSGYDVEIVEAHHRHKVDAPSGTALTFACAIAAAKGEELDGRVRYGREGANRRTAGEIGIHAVRAGGNPGEHTIILGSDGEEIRLSHRAFSRAAYAQGALRAARLIASLPPGWYEPATLPGFI